MKYRDSVRELDRQLGERTPEWRKAFNVHNVAPVTSPYIGEKYHDGGMLALISANEDRTIHDLVLSGLKNLASDNEAPLEFMSLAGMATVFSSKYGNDSALRENCRIAIQPDASVESHTQGALEAVNSIAVQRISAPTAESNPEGDVEGFYHSWLTEGLKPQIEMLKPFYIAVFGDNKRSWEILHYACDTVAWRRETALTSVGHIIGLQGRELVKELMFFDKEIEAPEDLQELVSEFKDFINGGFLLGSDEFSFVTRN